MRDIEFLNSFLSLEIQLNYKKLLWKEDLNGHQFTLGLMAQATLVEN